MSYYEIFIPLVAPSGVNLNTLVKELKTAVINYGYDVKKVSLTDIVSNQEGSTFDTTRNKIDIEGTRLHKLREFILKHVNENKPSEDKVLDVHELYSSLIIKSIQNIRKTTDKNTVYIIDNIKHPKELNALKRVYKNALFTVGVTDSLKGRISRKREQLHAEENGLTYNATVDKSVAYIVEDYLGKQSQKTVEIETQNDLKKINVSNNVGDAYLLSDFFINLNSSKFDTNQNSNELNILLKQSIERFVDLIFGAPNVTPTKQEHNMFMAYTSALRSGDLSRQVGSTIVNELNDVIAMGANEVPKSGGGQYWAEDLYTANTIENESILKKSADQRDYVIGHDTNAKAKDRLTEELVNLLFKKGLIAENKKTAVEDIIQKSPLKDITEYGRIVHAEMSALMSAARNGTQVKNMHMFCTTYPCHNCAKHLVAAGIKNVHYIEPYPKSRAVDSHGDSIFDPDSMNVGLDNNDQNELIKEISKVYIDGDLEKLKITNDGSNKLVFEPFSGVGPSRYVDLFSMNMGSGRTIKRKNDSQAVKLNRQATTKPRVPITATHNTFYEQEFITELEQQIHVDFAAHCQSALKSYHEEYTLQDENRQTSKVKFWHRKHSYGYIVSENGDDFRFNKQNIKVHDYIPNDGDYVSFIPLKGESVIFANEIIKVDNVDEKVQDKPSEKDEPKSFKSIIQNWMPERKIGYIKNLDGDNYFFKFDWVSDCSINKLGSGEKVSFEPVIDNNNLQAKNIKVLA